MDVLAGLTGIPLHGSAFVPEGRLVTMRDPYGQDRIYFHQRLSVRGKMRRKHGRPRNAPRRWKIKTVLYRPDFDRLREAAS